MYVYIYIYIYIYISEPKAQPPRRADGTTRQCCFSLSLSLYVYIYIYIYMSEPEAQLSEAR